MMFVHEQYGARAPARTRRPPRRRATEATRTSRGWTRGERGGLDPIEMAMLDAENVGVAGVPVSMMDAGEVDIHARQHDGRSAAPRVVETEYRGAKEGSTAGTPPPTRISTATATTRARRWTRRRSSRRGRRDFSAQVVADAQATPATQAQRPAAAAARAPDDCITPRGVRGRRGGRRRWTERRSARRGRAASALGGGGRSGALTGALAGARRRVAPPRRHMGAPRRAPSPALSDTTQ